MFADAVKASGTIGWHIVCLKTRGLCIAAVELQEAGIVSGQDCVAVGGLFRSFRPRMFGFQASHAICLSFLLHPTYTQVNRVVDRQGKAFM